MDQNIRQTNYDLGPTRNKGDGRTEIVKKPGNRAGPTLQQRPPNQSPKNLQTDHLKNMNT